MMSIVSASTEAKKRTRGPLPRRPGSTARVLAHTDFFGVYPEIVDGPQGFLVKVEGQILPHYHVVDQFQVVVDGVGTIGKHPLAPVAIHYTDAYTPYGPITPTDSTISFYTLRADGDTGSHRMPGSPKPVRSGRSFTVASGLQSGLGGDGPDRESPIEPQEDGLAAFVVRAGPGTPIAAPPPGGRGRYYLVVNGSCTVHGDALNEGSLVWAEADESLSATAGDAGTELVVLQFPLGTASRRDGE
jgi:hypothetical protein